jgi:hypothetical protein
MRFSSAARRSFKSTVLMPLRPKITGRRGPGKRRNGANGSVYANVAASGTIRRGDSVTRLQGALTLSSSQMSEKQGEQRAKRNHERSEEAHWQVAEAGAEEAESAPEDARPQADDQEDGWENEGGAFDREPKQAPEKGADDSQHD